jgi:hypothetical protein
VKIVAAGIVSQGVAGTARATQAFPGVAVLSSGVTLACYLTGTTKDSADETIEIRRSGDLGRSWSAPERPFTPAAVHGAQGSLKVCHLTELAPGHVLAAAMWVDRSTYPGQPTFNPETDGCLPMAILLAESRDFAHTWSSWRAVSLPEEVGPPSLTCPIMKLPDGALAMSIETNKTYLDRSQWYQRVVYFRSSDGGRTWGGPFVSGFDRTGRVFNWDQRAAVAPDGRIVAYTWVYDTETRSYRNVHRRISADGGQTWGPHLDMGVTDQPARPAIFPDGRVVFAWVDRFRTHSIRARLASSIDGALDPRSEVVVYEHGTKRKDDADPGGALGGPVWTYGLPFVEALPDGSALVVYYAGSETEMSVHWARLHLGG